MKHLVCREYRDSKSRFNVSLSIALTGTAFLHSRFLHLHFFSFLFFFFLFFFFLFPPVLLWVTFRTGSQSRQDCFILLSVPQTPLNTRSTELGERINWDLELSFRGKISVFRLLSSILSVWFSYLSPRNVRSSLVIAIKISFSHTRNTSRELPRNYRAEHRAGVGHALPI